MLDYVSRLYGFSSPLVAFWAAEVKDDNLFGFAVDRPNAMDPIISGSSKAVEPDNGSINGVLIVLRVCHSEIIARKTLTRASKLGMR